jgi:hypothetical protein
VVDVITTRDFALAPGIVAGFAVDPDNAPKWYENIKSIEWKTKPPLAVGSKIAFVAHFLGKRLSYTYEVIAFVENHSLVMRTSEGPFPMETSYVFVPLPDGGTRMTLRNRGEPAGFSRLVSPLMAFMMRRANRKDLARLARVLAG